MSTSYSWTEELIDLVLQQPPLIDSSHQDYRNIPKRDEIWDTLGDKLGTTGDDVKKRWRSLRDTYGRFVKRRRLYGGTGKIKKWVWADKMEPLRTHLTSGDSDCPEPSPDADGDYSLDNTNDTANEDQRATSTENIVYDPCVPEVTLATTSSPILCHKRKFPVDWRYFEDDRGPQMDPIDLLFLAHAGTVKTFSGKRQAITKLKIAQVIMEQELLHQEDINEN